jgi:hypothetical protein
MRKKREGMIKGKNIAWKKERKRKKDTQKVKRKKR